MWNRSELKYRGKTAFKRNYWWCVLVALILMLIGGTGSSSRNAKNTASEGEKILHPNTFTGSYDFSEMPEYWQNGEFDFSDFDFSDFDPEDFDFSEINPFENFDPKEFQGYDNLQEYLDEHAVKDGDHEEKHDSNEESAFSVSSNLGIDLAKLLGSPFGIVAAALTGFAALLAIAITLVITVFVLNPISVGGSRFFLDNAESAYQDNDGKPTPSTLLYAFSSGNYGTIVVTMLLKAVYLFLWTLLLIIPGIIKAYEYRMVPYLLADCPELSREEIFSLSKDMMYGSKWSAFVLDLSFIGWGLLNAITLGLVGIFYSNPYKNATDAELYLELKRQYRQGASQYTYR